MTDKECEEKLVRIAELVYRINSRTEYTARLMSIKRIIYVSVYKEEDVLVRLSGDLDDRYVSIGIPSIDEIITKLEEVIEWNS